MTSEPFRPKIHKIPVTKLLSLSAILQSLLICDTSCCFSPDLNECQGKRHNCDVNAWCTNTAGSYRCFCKKGYRGDGTKCEKRGTINIFLIIFARRKMRLHTRSTFRSLFRKTTTKIRARSRSPKVRLFCSQVIFVVY